MQDSDQDQDHRLALVTGATGAIGKAIVLQIAQQPEYRVVLLCRDQCFGLLLADPGFGRTTPRWLTCQGGKRCQLLGRGPGA